MACDYYSSIADQLYRLERALIDSGEATPSRKQLQAYTSKMSGPIGLARSQFFKLPSYHYHCHHHPFHHAISIINFNPITRECQKHSTSTGTIALSRAVVPIHTSSFGMSRKFG